MRMLSVNQMRAEITKVYATSPTWSHRVNRMYDDQVIAIYYKFLKDGRFNTVKKKFKLPGREYEFKNPYKNYQLKQLNMFDILKEKENVEG